MKSLYALLALAVLTLVSTAKGQILVSNISGTSLGSIQYYGQSFTTPDDGTADILSGFTWLGGSLHTPIGTGDLYLFSQAYTGTVAGLSLSDSGALAEATWNSTSKTYNFSLDSITLQPNTTYYVYLDHTFAASEVNNSGTDLYPGGDEYTATGTGDYTIVPNGDVNFEVLTATPTPEPSTYALGGLAVVGFFVMRKFPRRNKASARR